MTKQSISFLVFLLICTSRVFAIELPFEVHEVVRNNNTIAPYVIDFDQDGDPDIVVFGVIDDSNLQWYENQGDASFVRHIIPYNGEISYIEIADFNLDGHLDIVTTNRQTDQVAILINDNNQNFTPHELDITVEQPISVKPIDLDLDGDTDLVSGSYGWRENQPGYFRWHENIGNFEFKTHLISEELSRSWRVFPTDFDLDGDIDVFGTTMYGGLNYYENDGSQSFTKIEIFQMGNIRSVLIEDVDQDGDNDVVAGSLNRTRLRWFENKGNSSLVEHFISNFDIRVIGMKSGDIDLDGEIDYAFTQYMDKKVIWFERVNQDHFILHEIAEANRITNDMNLADMDHDGDLDIVCILGEKEDDQGDLEDDLRVVWIENKRNIFTALVQWYNRLKYYALSLLVIAVIFYLGRRSMIKEKIRLENTVKERTKELQSERDYLSSIIKTSPVCIFGFSPDGAITFINPSGEQMIGLSNDKLQGKAWWEISPVADIQEKFQSIHSELFDSPVYECEQSYISFSGEVQTLVWIFMHRLDEDGELEEIVAFTHDISQHVEREIMETSAREQRKIGREIHDSLCQSLTGITFKCDALLIHSEQESFSQSELVKDIRDHLKDVTTQSRKLARGLYLYELENQGLHVAYIELTRNIERLFNVKCEYVFNQEIRIEDFNTATHLYRIAQEAISNAVKYSKSSLIQLIVNIQPDQLTIIVKDDGIGFEPKAHSRKGMGLNIMLYRAKVIKAALNFESKLGDGTKVIVTLKLPDSNYNHAETE